MSKQLLIIGVIILAAIAGWIFFTNTHTGITLPASGEVSTETVVITPDGQVVSEDAASTNTMENTDTQNNENTTKEIFVTDGTRHTVPLDEILSGGPPQGGIPSIDNPQFITPDAADEWLADDEPGIALSRNGVSRFYPYQILVWHEIVNDTIAGERVLVTYCPLCLSGFVFDPLVDGERVEFGTSGKLWKSNLVMYDRKTDTYWSQILGEAVVGPQVGAQLSIIPSDQILYGNWKKQHPDGEVLSRDTGAARIYGSNPYGSYFSATDLALNLANTDDDRLAPDALVFGVNIDGQTKAYHLAAVQERGVVTDVFAGRTFVLRHIPELDVVRMFEVQPDGSEERITPFSTFWFSWAAAHPDTALLK